MARKLGIFHQDFAKGLNRDTDEVLYINFGLFEDIFLNNLLIKTNDGKSNKYDCKFVSHDCYARWNENLFLRQTEQLLPNEDLPVFLYPSSDQSETYNSDKTHDDLGFEEPLIALTPAIGPSEVMLYSGDYFSLWKNKIIMSSLKAQSLFIITLNESFNKINHIEKIHIASRIRDFIVTEEGMYLVLEGRYQNQKDTPNLGKITIE